jgi:hypothetical protein
MFHRVLATPLPLMIENLMKMNWYIVGAVIGRPRKFAQNPTAEIIL